AFIDLVDMRQLSWDEETLGMVMHEGPIPVEHAEEAAAAREQMIEALAEADDKIMEKWVAGQAVDADELRAGLGRATLSLRPVPVLLGAAFKNKGVHPLLDAVV